jgi:hypothetical protein
MAEVVYSLGRQQFVFCRRVSRARCVMLLRDEDEDDELLPIADRAEAGRILGTKLLAYSGRNDVIVQGLPRRCGG